MKGIWQLQEAKVKFSEVINKAIKHDPQVITKHGVETAFVISSEEYKRLKQKKSKISQFFKSSPITDVYFENERNKDYSRGIKL